MIRVCVGAAANNEDLESFAVLEASIRRHTSQPIDIHWMRLTRDPGSFWYSGEKGEGWNTAGWHTPFSGFRWGIPAYFGFQGKAIYCDSDFIFRADIAELWNQPLNGRALIAKNNIGKTRYCSTVMDCARLEHLLPSILEIKTGAISPGQIAGMFKDRPDLVEKFVGDWNCIDGEKHEDLGDVTLKALHYSRMPTQPHLRHALPRLAAAGESHWFNGTLAPHARPDVEELFDTELAIALQEGYALDRYAVRQPFGSYVKKDLRHF